MFIIRNRKIWYTISGLLVLASVFSLLKFGLKSGMDFTGGSLLEVEYKNERPSVSDLQEKIKQLDLGGVMIQPTGEKGLTMRIPLAKDDAGEFNAISEEKHLAVVAAISSEDSPVTELRFDSVGPTIGRELATKSWIAITFVALMIILYIAFAFRKVSRPVSSFKYGLMAVLALIHDVTIPTGIFALLGHYKGVEVDVLFVTALLTILGFSVHDTIVVFDRVRENLRHGAGKDFEETVGLSVKETLTRSVNTSLTVLIVVVALFLFGGEVIRYFSLALIFGVFFGTYSSIFLASPFLVTAYGWQERRKKK